MLDVIEHRDRRASTMIASQIPVERWHCLVRVGTTADAIVAWIVSYAHTITLTGDSLREAPPGLTAVRDPDAMAAGRPGPTTDQIPAVPGLNSKGFPSPWQSKPRVASAL